MWIALALVPIGYLLGNLPSALIVANAKGVDITATGSGNPGASNVIRVLGWRAGAVVLLCDFAKGAAASGLGLGVSGRGGAYLLGVACVVGHTFPIKRKGGKGVAAAGGMLVVLFPLIVALVGVVWAVVARVLHKASIASLTICVLFPVLAAVFRYDWWEVGVIALIAALLIARHAANIRRLMHHEESDLAPRGG